MGDPSTRLDEMIAALREKGCRFTPQRLAVLKILAASDKHPGVEEIWKVVKKDFPMTSVATIYKTVTLLKQMGQAMELSFAGISYCYDGRKPYPHPHLMCIRCKRIIDPDIDHSSELSLSKKVSRKTGYQIVSHRLDFFGICPRCQEKE